MNLIAEIWNSAKSVIPLAIVLVVINLVIFKRNIDNPKEIVIGLVLVCVGLAFFVKGAEKSLIELGEVVGNNFQYVNQKWIVLFIGFVVGYLGTLVEPALKTVAQEVETLSAGAIPSFIIMHAVAAGFGIGLTLGLSRIIYNISFLKILLPILILCGVLALFSPPPFNALAFDVASATTGPVNIPLNMAIAVGLAKIIEGADPLTAGFGVIGFTTLCSIVTVLILGIATKFI